MDTQVEITITESMYMRKSRNGIYAIRDVKMPVATGNEPCNEYDLDTFFTENETKEEMIVTAMAKQACSRCPLIIECFTWGVNREAYGIWGGTTRHEREAIREKYMIAMSDPRFADQYLAWQKKLRPELIKDLEMGEYGEEENRFAKAS